MKHSTSLTRNVLSNWVLLTAGLFAGLLITPAVVDALGQELYGVWSFLNGLLAYTELFYLGLGAALVKSVSQHRVRSETDKISRVLSVVATIYGAIGLSCFVAFAVLSTWVPLAFAQPLSDDSAALASRTFVLLGAQILFAFVGSAFAGTVAAYERYDLENLALSVGVVLRVSLILTLVPGASSPMLTLVSITVSTTALQAVLLAGIVFWLEPSLKIRPARPTRDELNYLYGFGAQVFFIVAAFSLINYTDTTVIGVMLGASSVALYAVPLALVQQARSVIRGFTRVLLPQIVGLLAKGDLEGVRQAYLRAIRISFFIGGWASAGIVALGPTFISRWIGPDFGEPVQWVAVWLAVALLAQVLYFQTALPFYQALGVLKVPAIVLTLEALANLGLSVLLAPPLGITGVALGSALPALLLSSVLLTPYLCRRLELPLARFVSDSLRPGILMAVTAGLVLWASGLVSTTGSYVTIAFRAACTIPCAIVVFRITFPAEERSAAWNRLTLVGRRVGVRSRQ